MTKLINLFDKEYNPSDEKDFARAYHTLMRAYESWIPLEEFKKLSPELVRDLLEFCHKDSEEIKRKSRRR